MVDTMSLLSQSVPRVLHYERALEGVEQERRKIDTFREVTEGKWEVFGEQMIM